MQGFFKFFSFFVLFTVGLSNSLNSYRDSSVVDRFKNWVNQHRIQARDDSHLAHMFDNWLENDKFIEITNGKNLTYTLGHNAYSGMNLEEFGEFMGFRANAELLDRNKGTGFLRGSNNKVVSQSDATDSGKSIWTFGSVPTVQQDDVLDLSALPTSVDWRTKGVVTNVKSQGNCGSCWSFSTTGALEGIYAIKYGNLVSFSEQQLVDCDNGITKNHACNGGLMDVAFSFISSNGGLCTEQEYPYVSGTTQKACTCQTSCKSVSGSKISKYTDITPNSDSAMMTALAQQPVSVGVYVTNEFQLYKSGIFTAKCGTDLNHGVLLVGYSSDNGQDYYILKNSWGSGWGMENGYMRLGKNIDPSTGKPYNNGAGQCGVLTMASYPSL